MVMVDRMLGILPGLLKGLDNCGMMSVLIPEHASGGLW